MPDIRRPDYHRATRDAYRTLLAIGANQLPIDVAAICNRCKNTRLLTFKEAHALVGDSFYAFWDGPSRYADMFRRDVNGKTYFIIAWNDMGVSKNSGLFRYTIAHELAHVILRHEDGNSPAEESEATCFAQHLLCPRPVLEAMQPASHIDISFSCGVTYGVAQTVYRSLKLQNPFVDDDVRNGIRKAFDLDKDRSVEEYIPLASRDSWKRARDQAERERSVHSCGTVFDENGEDISDQPMRHYARF